MVAICTAIATGARMDWGRSGLQRSRILVLGLVQAWCYLLGWGAEIGCDVDGWMVVRGDWVREFGVVGSLGFGVSEAKDIGGGLCRR